MRRTSIAALVAGLWFCGFLAVSAQSDRSAVEGVWEVRDITFAKPPANLPNKPTGIVIFSGNHYSMTFLGNAGRPNLAQFEIAKATADQLRAGNFTENTFTLKGDTLTLTTAKSAKGAVPNPQTLHLVRAK